MVKVEQIYTQFFKSEHIFLKIFFYRTSSKPLFNFLADLMKYNLLSKWQYISQIKLDLYKDFRTTCWGYQKMIQHNKAGQIIIKSIQEPSMSYKYNLFPCLGDKIQDKTQEWNIIVVHDAKFDTKDDPIL